MRLKAIPEIPQVGVSVPAPGPDGDSEIEYRNRVLLKLSDRLAGMLEELRLERGLAYGVEVVRSLILEAHRRECRKDRSTP